MHSSNATLPHLSSPILRRHWQKKGDQRIPLPSSGPSGDNANQVSVESFVRESIELAGRLGSTVRHWWISSVQDAVTKELMQAIQDCKPMDSIELLDRSKVPMELDVREPLKVGIDRLLAAWGAWMEIERASAVIVVQAGTAVTIDLVDASGCFQGGAIMAGVPLALRLLSEGTSRLPLLQAPHDFQPVAIPGKNTEEAMLAGVSSALIGGVRWLAEKYRAQVGSSTVPIIVSGGDSPSFARWLPEPVLQVDHLILRAIAALAER